MRKKLFLTSLAVLFLFGASYDVRAQSRKPSQVLRELTEERKRAMKDFESEDPGDPYAFLDERAKVEETIRAKAAQAASGFKIAEWKGEDLIALSTLYSLAEMKPQAVEALRAALASEPKGRNAPMLELRLIRTLLDLDQLQEAKNRIESLQSPAALRSAGPLPGILLYRDLASALAARGEHENAANQAEKGYLLSEAVLASGNAPEEIEVRIRTEQLKLAAAAIASFEKAGKKQDAERLARLVEKFDIKSPPVGWNPRGSNSANCVGRSSCSIFGPCGALLPSSLIIHPPKSSRRNTPAGDFRRSRSPGFMAVPIRQKA
jgi:tetratricopeptide (TPR) repeat protein